MTESLSSIDSGGTYSGTVQKMFAYLSGNGKMFSQEE